MGERGLWWLSFCDGERAEGEQFLGACVVEGKCIVSAALDAHRRECNPGGEVMGVEIPDDMRRFYEPAVGRLMTRAECEAFDDLIKAALSGMEA